MTRDLTRNAMRNAKNRLPTICVKVKVKKNTALSTEKFHVAKLNLGEVNLEAMLVSSFPSYIRGGPMPLAGAPCDLYTQLLACSSSQSVVEITCCLHSSLCLAFSHPSLLPSWGMGYVSSGSVSIPLNCSVWRCLVGATHRVAMDTSSSC